MRKTTRLVPCRGAAPALLVGLLLLMGASASAVAASPVRTVPLSFESRGGRINGELLLPHERGRHPAVAMLPGSGADTRDAYRPVAERFAQSGVAALIFDERGAGRSEGSVYHRYAELADDARAAVMALRTRKDIADGRVALWARGEGGFVAPLAAAGFPQVAAVLVVSPSALPPVVQQEWAVRNGLRSSGASGVGTRAMRILYRVAASVGRTPLASLGARRTRDMTFDPASAWRHVSQPVLAVWGAGDTLVPIRDSAAALQRALAAGPNRDRVFVTFPEAGHDLGVVTSDGRRVYAPGYMKRSARWLRARLARAKHKPRVHTPLPPGNGVVAPRAVQPGWADDAWLQFAWLLVPAVALIAVGVRTVIRRRQLQHAGAPAGPAGTSLMRMIGAANVGAVLCLVALGVGIARIAAADGQQVETVAGYPLALLPALALLVLSVALTVTVTSDLVRGRASAARRWPGAATACVAGAAWAGLAAYWLL